MFDALMYVKAGRALQVPTLGRMTPQELRRAADPRP
jgi:hypothetical protein